MRPGGQAIALPVRAFAAARLGRILDDHGLAVVPFDLPPNRYLRFSSLYRREDLERCWMRRGGVAYAIGQ